MVCKEKAKKTAEHEDNLANLGIKPIPALVFFISLVGSDPFGKVDDNDVNKRFPQFLRDIW